MATASDSKYKRTNTNGMQHQPLDVAIVGGGLVSWVAPGVA